MDRVDVQKGIKSCQIYNNWQQIEEQVGGIVVSILSS